MDAVNAPPSHLVPPLPQRRSTATTRNNRTENQLLTSGQHQHSSTFGYHLPSTIFSSVAPTHRRAINNEYRDLRHPVMTSPTTTRDVTTRPALVQRDVIVEISSRGEPIARTTGVDAGSTLSTWKPAVEANSGGVIGSDRGHHPRGEPIICADCGKCRCAECAKTSSSSLSSLSSSALPSKLCCLAAAPVNQSSASCCELTIDAVSCVCCVRALIPRRVGEPDPCSCRQSSPTDESASTCCRRWAFLVALSACVPCLCLYVPLRCLLYACGDLCVDSRQRGCRCRPPLVSPLAAKDEKGSYVAPSSIVTSTTTMR